MSELQSLWQEQPALKRGWLALGFYNVVLGAALLAGSAERMQGPSFAFVRDFGGAASWGSAFALVGAAILLGAQAGRRTLAAVCMAGAIAHAFFAAQFVVAALDEPTAALTGPPTYLIVAWWHASVAIAYRVGSMRPAVTRA